ncbi:MAG: FHIPEP family type III secretion protein [Sandaracinaceae bacterium]|nr:FHIPEP family type III secretion protein [Sandaracinaceae bacterium]
MSRGALRTHLPEIVLATLVVLVVGMMIVPLPTWLLDLLIATNLSLGVLLLLTAFFVRRPLSFASFPTILLVTTLFRLALNVSSTRLILLQADAGTVIAAFGEFVVQGSYVVGAVIFAILTLVQFVVIARGSERVAEVGARFTLDALPGKQLAIDADLRSGRIDADGAAALRRELERESQLYGAMDGAMKFVKGDAIAAIVITCVNIVGGLAIGMLDRDLGAGEALETYGLLTIGDGLVSQIPALLISTAAGLVVTRVASEHEDGTLGADIGAQVFGDWRALAVASGFAFLLAIVPGLPLVPFLVLGAALGVTATVLYRRRPTPRLRTRDPGAPRSGPLELRVGARLGEALMRGTELGPALDAAADALYAELGVRLPALTPVVSAQLGQDAWELRLGAVRVDRGEGRDANALVARVVDAVRKRPEALVGLQEIQRELDRLATEAPALVRQVLPGRLSLPRLTTLLEALVAERVSIGSLREILEAASRDPLPEGDELVEVIRQRLARPITHALMGDEATLRVRPVDPLIEDALRDSPLDPELANDIIAAIRGLAEPEAVLLTQPDVRRALFRLLASELPGITVLSYPEVDPEASIERLAMVSP